MRRAIRLATCAALALGLAVGPAAAQQASQGNGAELRVLDKVTGIVTDVQLASGAAEPVGHLTLRLNECRYPADNPSGDAFAELTITYQGEPVPVFAGWMIASAPALNAMEHPRYDVWVLRCSTS